MSTPVDELSRLRADIATLIDQMREAEVAWTPWIEAAAPQNRESARNLVHYWAIRQVDLRDTQAQLASFGLSSLGRSEGHVLATMRAVAAAIDAIDGQPWHRAPRAGVEFGEGAQLLARNADNLLGPLPDHEVARIMVTLPSDAATDRDLVARLLQRGMAVARINCAHDDAAAWRAMASNVRSAAQAAGRSCVIAMDLSGPKLRTGPLQPGPKVLRLRPVRDTLGRAVVPARGWLTSATAPAPAPAPDIAAIPVPGGWLRTLRDGDVLELRDTRDSRRWLEVNTAADGGALISCEQTVYLGTGTRLSVVGTGETAEVGELPAVEQALRLRAGDVLRVTPDLSPAPVGGAQPRIGCTLPEVFGTAAVGDRVYFDDGKLGGRVVAVDHEGLQVRIDHPQHAQFKLRAGKGINVPDTDLPIPALSEKDLQDLSTVVEIADIVNLSFVRSAEDVAGLLDELGRLGDEELGIVLKIETQAAFRQLPQLALTAMRRRQVGVMIARGDLAVECGYERLAEMQEQILWLCEAAHLPVIWATQVLEQLAKTGLPSRAEISDAAMSERAECVMLNKGPHIEDAVSTLHDILVRAAGHHYKKNALLRPLRSWEMAVPG